MNNRQREHLQDLESAYREAGKDAFALFLGAGVNKPITDEELPYKMYGWLPLLEELHRQCRDVGRPGFEALLAEYGEDWRRLASEIKGSISEEAFASILDRVIYNGDMPRCDSKKRLADSVLEQMPALHAAICFASAIAEQTESSKGKKNWSFCRNPKVGAVLTTNYDYFFAAGWTRYQAFGRQWKVQTPFSHKETRGNQRPIYYLHGYLPYRPTRRKEIVLSEETYRHAYEDPGYSIRVLHEEARSRSLIFIGFSFTDSAVCGVLEDCRDARQHYAFVRRASDSMQEIERLGIRPIIVEKYGEIASILRTVYTSRIDTQEHLDLDLPSPAHYWRRLWLGKA
jgi:hypothetical protein